MKKKIAIFASGSGSNARKIMERFAHDEGVEVALLVSNKKDAGALDIARSFGVETLTIGREVFQQPDTLLSALRDRNVDFIVLAGYLWLMPESVVAAFERRMVNIHPALLPKYGGKGMYGMRVHEAVKAAGEKETGITIHWVNHLYDEGGVVFQAVCAVDESDSPADIAHKVQALEHEHFPVIVERLVRQLP